MIDKFAAWMVRRFYTPEFKVVPGTNQIQVNVVPKNRLLKVILPSSSPSN